MIFAAVLLSAAPQPTVAYTIDPKHRIVEGIASDGKNLWLTSILDRVVLRCEARCTPAFTLEGPGYPLGIAWDADRQWLWIAMHCLELKGIEPCEGELRAVDRRGRIRYSGRPADNFKPGDVSVHRGVVTVSDTANGSIYNLYRQRFHTILPAGRGKSAQGSATLPNGRTVVVADYSKGISTFPVSYGPQTLTRLANGKSIQGIDGMTAAAGRLFGVYNGRSPGKLLEFNIDGPTISYREIPDGGLLPDPTQVTIHRGAIYMVGDSGWATIERQIQRAAGATIVRIELPESAN